MKIIKNEFRELFLRNAGYCESKNDFPVIYREEFNLDSVKLIGCHNIKKNDFNHQDCGVHFYKWDNKLEKFYKNPYQSLEILKQYKFVLTPDFSVFLLMNLNVQRMNIFRNRWCGNFWQRNGLTVYPSAAWGGKETFSWCNAGLPEHGTIAVSTLGTFKENKQTFLDGYFNLLKQKSPENILCYGKVHQEMKGTCNIISCIHEAKIAKQEAELNMFKRLYPHSLFEFEENVI